MPQLRQCFDMEFFMDFIHTESPTAPSGMRIKAIIEQVRTLTKDLGNATGTVELRSLN